MKTTEQKNIVEQKPKPGRRRKKAAPPGYENRKRLVIDKAHTPKTHALAIKLLTAANRKEHGREVTFDHLIALALSKVNAADLNRLKDESLADMDRVNLKLKQYNSQNKTNLTLGEFLVKQLEIKNQTEPQEEPQ